MSSDFDVSVIIPSYNSEEFIRRSVGSALEQTGLAVQIVVVDDQGKDNTRQILADIADANPNRSIVVEYRGAGLGQATARNRGIELSTGRYIAFLDSDDAFASPQTLAHWVRYADDLGLDMAGGQYDHVAADGVATRARTLSATGFTPVSVLTNPGLCAATSCWQFIYRRDFLNGNGIIFSPRLRQREDRLFLIEAMLKASKIGVLAESVVLHFAREDSSFRQVDRSQLEQYVQHVKELNAAIAAARAAGRISDDFETANSSIYFSSLFKYWYKLYSSLMDSREAKKLLAAFKAEFRTLASRSSSYFDNALIAQIDLADAAIAEGNVDLLRIAIDQDNDVIIGKLLTRMRISLPDLMPMAKDTLAEKIVCRYVSFTRDTTVVDPGAAKKPLAKLVSRVVLHVGAPKTGSSSLQHTFERNRLRLIDNGIHYPVTGTYREFGIRRERSAGHARLISSLLDGNQTIIDELCAEIEALKKPIHTLVLSSENVLSPRFWNPETGLSVILDRLGAPNVEIVAVLRKQDDWIRSLYIEQISNPWNKFIDSFASLVEAYASIDLFDYQKVLHALEAPSQVTALHVGSFEKIRENFEILPWFTRALKFPDIEYMPILPEQKNVSRTETQAALIKIAKANPALKRPELTKVFQFVEKHPEMSGGTNVLISESDIARFRAAYAPHIAEYCKRFGVPDRPPRPAATAPEATLTLTKEMLDLLTTRTKPPEPKPKPTKEVVVPTGPSPNNLSLAMGLARSLIPFHVNEVKVAWTIWRSGLFDTGYYLRANPDVAKSGEHPLFHYLRYGAYEGRKPNPNLDLTNYIEEDIYLKDNSVIFRKGINPLIQYLRFK